MRLVPWRTTGLCIAGAAALAGVLAAAYLGLRPRPSGPETRSWLTGLDTLGTGYVRLGRLRGGRRLDEEDRAHWGDLGVRERAIRAATGWTIIEYYTRAGATPAPASAARGKLGGPTRPSRMAPR